MKAFIRGEAEIWLTTTKNLVEKVKVALLKIQAR